MIDKNTLIQIARDAGLKEYDFDGYYTSSLSDAAERQTNGRTHYFDEGTRKYFKSSVSKLRTIADGMALAAIERVSLDPDHTRKGYRTVIINIDGAVINDRPDFDQCSATLRQEERRFEIECAKFSGLTVLSDVLERKQKDAERARAYIESAIQKLKDVQ